MMPLLMILSLIKAVFTTPFSILMSLPSIIFINVIMFIYDFPMSYYTVIISPRIGKTVTFFLIILLIAIIPLGSAIMLATACLVAILVAFGYPFFETYSLYFDNKNVLETSIFQNTIWAIQEYWKFHYNSVPAYLADLRTPGPVFEITIVQIFIALILTAVSMVVDGVAIALMLTCKVPFVWFRTMAWILQAWFESNMVCICGVPAIIALILGTVGVFVGYPICIIGGIFYGINSAVVLYKKRYHSGRTQTNFD